MSNKNTYSVAFLTRTARSKGKNTLIYCRITVNSQRTEFSIKRSVTPKLWNNGSVRGKSEEACTLRTYLKQVEAKLFEHYRNLLADNETVTVEALKRAYLGIKTQLGFPRRCGSCADCVLWGRVG